MSLKPAARLYLAGPMRGLPLYNFPAFDAAAAELRRMGYTVFNPAEHDREVNGFDPAKDTHQPMRHYMATDLQQVCLADAVAVLPGWGRSQGALLEIHVARECQIPVLWAGTLQPITVLEEAQELVYGARGANYGHPYDDYRRTVDAFRALTGLELTPEQGAMFMVCVKLSRESHRPKRDNRVDGAGYLACLDLMRERQAGA